MLHSYEQPNTAYVWGCVGVRKLWLSPATAQVLPTSMLLKCSEGLQNAAKAECLQAAGFAGAGSTRQSSESCLTCPVGGHSAVACE